MDWVNVSGKAMERIKKYRFVLLILLAGILLMSLPEEKKEDSEAAVPAAQTQQKDLQASLEEILSQVHGAGKVRVLLTQSAGERTVYQTDEDASSGENTNDIRRQTVIVTDSERVETGLVEQTIPPSYLGAIVLCQGADSAAVRLSIVEAVANATGLTTDKISVLKMK